MSDKTREEFEEEYPIPTGVYWHKTQNNYSWTDYFWVDEAIRQQLKFEAWLAAKERYEPMWISVEERMPETWDFKICYSPMNGILIACLMNDGEFRMENTNLRVRVTHWMEWPSIPSTQGGGE